MILSDREIVERIEKYSARHYKRFFDFIPRRAKDALLFDAEDEPYLDLFTAYSAVSLGHNQPAIERATAKNLPMVSREYPTESEALFLEALARISGFESCRIVIMNSGAEAVETAIKLARMWARRRKGIFLDKTPEIVVAYGNFHGRTYGVLSASTTAHYKDGFGPFLPGFVYVPYGDIGAMERAINPHTAAVLLEPIQGEAGIIIPPEGYLRQVRDLCKERNVLSMWDEVQTGFGRTGRMFAWEHEDARPDVLVLAKALGGGRVAISAVLASSEIMEVLEEGTHGSTFGGNAFACAAGYETIKILTRSKNNLVERSARLGPYLMGELRGIHSPLIKEVRGRGLFIGVELAEGAGRPLGEPRLGAEDASSWRRELFSRRMIVGGTRDPHTFRLTPPLVITKKQLDDWFLPAFEDVAKKFSRK